MPSKSEFYFFQQNKVLHYCQVRKNKLHNLMVASNLDLLYGCVFLAKVTKFLTKDNAAFVDIGLAEDAYLEVDTNSSLISSTVAASSTDAASLHEGQFVLVQLIKLSCGSKRAKVTTNIKLAAAYLVNLVSQRDVICFSNKIKNKEDISRLSALLTQNSSLTTGWLVRTAAKGVADAAIVASMDQLNCIREQIFKSLQQNFSTPRLIYQPDFIYLQLMQDRFADATVYADSFMMQELAGFSESNNLSMQNLKAIPDFIDASLINLQSAKVNLQPHGNIIIESTSALTAIDVNAAAFNCKSGAKQDFIFNINKNAASEIALQLRLRNISGIVVIDFINMKQKKHRQYLLEHLAAEVACDLCAVKIGSFSDLGLVELSRQFVAADFASVYKNLDKK